MMVWWYGGYTPRPNGFIDMLFETLRIHDKRKTNKKKIK